MQTIEYHGDATIAVDLVLAGLLADDWSPGDWFVEVSVLDVNTDAVSQVDGDLIYFEMGERGGIATVHPKDPETGLWTAEPVEIDTNNVVKLVIP